MIIEQSLDVIETISLRKLRSSPPIKPGMRKRKRSARLAASAFVGGIATNKLHFGGSESGNAAGEAAKAALKSTASAFLI